MSTLKIYGLNEEGIAFCEAQGLAKCFQAYADNCAGEQLLYDGIGFNANSGYTYIALENMIQICSMLGRDVEYMISDYETSEERFFDTYEEALESLNK